MPVTFMYFIYSLLLAVGFGILLPRFLIDAFRHGKYVAGFRERLGNVAVNAKPPVIWIHCVSVGETQAARPLVLRLKEILPGQQIVVSTTTLTGQTLAKQIFKTAVAQVFYFPFDWRRVVRRTLRTIQPAAVLIMETEIWPGFLRECENQNIPVAILNGRLSERSFRRYRLVRKFLKRVLRGVSLAIMQTEGDAERLKRLGMPSDKIHVAGSLKFDAGTLPVNNAVAEELRARFELKRERPLILAASTHAPEEKILLEAFKVLVSESCPEARLLIAPRHPERFGEVAALIASSGFAWALRSDAVTASDAGARIILLDTIGELATIYSLATVVFVGGSIAITGGHNVLEPAAVGACIVTGAYTFNFKDIVEAFVAADALIQIAPMPERDAALKLKSLFADLLVDDEKRRLLGARAQELVMKNRGATERTLALLTDFFDTSNFVAPHTANTQSQHDDTQ